MRKKLEIIIAYSLFVKNISFLETDYVGWKCISLP